MIAPTAACALPERDETQKEIERERKRERNRQKQRGSDDDDDDDEHDAQHCVTSTDRRLSRKRGQGVRRQQRHSSPGTE